MRDKNDKKIMKNQVKFLVFILTLVLCVFLGSSFAWYSVSSDASNSIVLDAGTLDVSVDSTSDLSLTDVVPESKSEALGSDGFKFTVNNKGSIPVNYTISLKDGTLDSGDTKLDDKYVGCVLYSLGTDAKTAVKDGHVSDFADGLVYTSSLNAGSSESYELKCYLDQDVFDKDAAGKTFKKYVSIKAVQKDS